MLRIVLCWALVGLEPCKGKILSYLILHCCSEMSLTLSRNNVGLEKCRIFPLHGERRNQCPTVCFPGKTPIFVLPFLIIELKWSEFLSKPRWFLPKPQQIAFEKIFAPLAKIVAALTKIYYISRVPGNVSVQNDNIGVWPGKNHFLPFHGILWSFFAKQFEINHEYQGKFFETTPPIKCHNNTRVTFRSKQQNILARTIFQLHQNSKLGRPHRIVSQCSSLNRALVNGCYSLRTYAFIHTYFIIANA